MQLTSTIQILLVEKQTSKKLNPETSKPYESTHARCILLSDEGAAVNVGTIRRINEDLLPQVVPGTFRANFALVVPDYGTEKGDIVAKLVGLTPVGVEQIRKVAPAPTPAPAAPKV